MSWRTRAACRGLDPDLFVPEAGNVRQDVAAAKAVCASCTVQADCLSDALAYGQELRGIWAGTTPRERRAMQHSGGQS